MLVVVEVVVLVVEEVLVVVVDVAEVFGACEGFEFFAWVELWACPVWEDHCAFGADYE